MDTPEEKLADLQPVNAILGRDLNVALDPTKDRNGSCPPSYGDVMRQRVTTLMEESDLTDVWRYRNPTLSRFTFHRGRQASRIDYWLISNHLADICMEADITHLSLSDHSMLTLSIGNQEPRRGPGLWRLDNSLLADDKYIEEISNLLESLIRESDDSDPSAK